MTPPPPFKKYFTLNEARALLPKLRQHFAAIHHSRERWSELERMLLPKFEATGGDLGGDDVNAVVRECATLQYHLLSVTNLGVLIKDVERGLVDFPHRRDGRVVFLCWELEEEDIEFWHEIDSGYAGREKL